MGILTIAGRQILVLNRSWSPIAVTTVRRAMSLVFRNHARIIHHQSFDLYTWDRWLAQCAEPTEEGEEPGSEYIRTVSLKIQLPQVITLARYNGIPSHRLPFSRRTLLKRDRYQCQYCGTKPGAKKLTIDHVVPRSRGGGTTWTNCVIACTTCNVRKGSRTLDESGLRLTRAPFRPSWMEDLLLGAELPVAWRKFVRTKAPTPLT